MAKVPTIKAATHNGGQILLLRRIAQIVHKGEPVETKGSDGQGCEDGGDQHSDREIEIEQFVAHPTGGFIEARPGAPAKHSKDDDR